MQGGWKHTQPEPQASLGCHVPNCVCKKPELSLWAGGPAPALLHVRWGGLHPHHP